MGWEDYTYPPLLRYCETGSTGDLGGIAAWGPWKGGDTPNQEWMRACLLFAAGVAGAREVVLAHLRHQAEHGHQYLGVRPNGRDSWSEQDSGIYENFWLVGACAARIRARLAYDDEMLTELLRWFGHHAARLAAVPLPASTGHPVGTPGARSSEPCMGPRSMAYHLLVAEQPQDRVRYWRGDNRAKELESAVIGCGIGRVTPRLDYVLRHPVKVWRGDGWSWQTCHGLPNVKPGPVATVAAGAPLPGGEEDRDAPGVLWSRLPIDKNDPPDEIQGFDPSAPSVKPPKRKKPKPPPTDGDPPPTDEPYPTIGQHPFEGRGSKCYHCYLGKRQHGRIKTGQLIPRRVDDVDDPVAAWGVDALGSPR